MTRRRKPSGEKGGFGQRERGADETWCVCDTEGTQNRHLFDKAKEEADRRGIKLAASNPAFEYWYLLHFEDTGRPFSDANELMDVLRKYLPDYDKAANVFSELEQRTQKAIDNAYRQEDLAGGWEGFPNPSTGVANLVEKILELGRARRHW